MDYFHLRGIDPSIYENSQLPAWLTHQLRTVPKDALILDFGCGFGQNMKLLREQGYTNVHGADVDARSISHCKTAGLSVFDTSHGLDALTQALPNIDLVFTSHVLEHIPKDAVIDALASLRLALKDGGILLAAVPNAQAFTGAYWAYEDFTHSTLYTSGSLTFILRAAGFSKIDIIDRRATDGLGALPKLVRTLSSMAFGSKYAIGKKLLASPTHVASVDVFTYEVKAMAVK